MARTIEKVLLGFVLIVVLGLGSLIGVAFNSDNKPNTVKSNGAAKDIAPQKISYEQAMSIASGWYGGKIGKIESETVNGREVYSVEFEEVDKETAVIIDPYTGQVLKVEREDNLGRRELEMIQPNITKEQAKAAALSTFNGKITGVDTKKINGMYVYDEEIDEDDLSQQEISNIKASVTEQDAIQIALKRVSGEVTDVEIERKQGHEVYTVEIDDNGDEVDVFVDVKTGEIVGTERDSEEDEEDEDD